MITSHAVMDLIRSMATTKHPINNVMAVITIGEPHVLGITTIKPIMPEPQGKVRIKLRPNDLAKAYIKTDNRITGYYIKDNGDHWQLSYVIGINHTRQHPALKKDNHTPPEK